MRLIEKRIALLKQNVDTTNTERQQSCSEVTEIPFEGEKQPLRCLMLPR
jgi:hypothetical protein